MYRCTVPSVISSSRTVFPTMMSSPEMRVPEGEEGSGSRSDLDLK